MELFSCSASLSSSVIPARHDCPLGFEERFVWRKCLLLQCLRMHQVFFFCYHAGCIWKGVGGIPSWLCLSRVSVCEMFLHSFMLVLCAHDDVSCLKPQDLVQLYSQFLLLVTNGVQTCPGCVFKIHLFAKHCVFAKA